MQINSVNNTSFQSRNPQIRQADKLLRFINQEFPAVSLSRFEKYFSHPQSQNPNLQLLFVDNDRYLKNFKRRNIPTYIHNRFLDMCNSFRRLRNCYFALQNKFDTATFYKYFAKSTQGNAPKIFTNIDCIGSGRFANCAEQTNLARLILGVNGIDSIPVSIKRYRSTISEKLASDNSIKTFNLPLGLEHNFVIVPTKGKNLSKDYVENTPLAKLKDCLIFDPWCGFVDTPANAALKYFGEHDCTVGKPIRSLIRMPEDNLYYDKIYLSVLDNKKELEINDSTREKLRQIFPELIVK